MESKTFFNTYNRFWAIQSIRSEIKAREIALFGLLLHAAGKQGWPENFEASTTAICQALGCKRQSFTRSRVRLKDCNIIDFTEGNRSQKARYWFTFSTPMVLKTDSKCNESVTPTKERKKERERESTENSTTLSFEKIVSDVEAEFPARSDVRKLAERMDSRDGVVNADRLKQWVQHEKHPEFKPPPAEVEPVGWRARFAAEYPDALEPGPWSLFAQKYPEIANEYRPKNTGVLRKPD